MSDYIKILQKMREVSGSFDEFIQSGKKNDFYQFIKNETDDYHDFVVVVDGAEVTVSVMSGATKAVFAVEGMDTVAKIGFQNFKVDHAAREAQIYQEACGAHLEQFFVPCKKIGEISNLEVFEMELVDVGEELVTSDMWRKCSGSMSNEEIVDVIDEDCGFVESLFPFYYSNEEMTRLYEFISELEINDLHSGNIGYENGRIVIIDYSGYFPF